MPKLFYPDSEAAWLELRLSDVTSTEIASLFYDALGDLPSYCATPLEYYHQKKEFKVIEFDGNERIDWGLAFEQAIAQRVSEKYGVKVRKLNAYARHNNCRMGASFDFDIVGIREDVVPADTCLQEMYAAHGAGVLEIKVVDYFIFADPNKWDKGKRKPDHIELQVQHQLEVIDRNWTALCTMVGGNKLHLFVCERDVELGRALVTRVNEFWKMIEDGTEPTMDFKRDAEFIAKLFSHAEPGTFLDARENVELAALCKLYQNAGEAEKIAKNDKEAYKAEILSIIGDTEKVAADGFSISAAVTAEAHIEAYTRKAFRNFRVTAKKA